ncbi:transcriptional regulator NrdR [Tessaracoccus caeni]|uniref:transcriptional regulator NrdR n=1 Tax=Tessaracoccus caeni TaxID=3031239 RepID=UPI0023DBF621|nr:transcriptional regulator NrdR [Tessaracoccus caeni]MDF1487929.1 transcriptional regulator NrdR [Tessaracoccus caeni]
MRCPFCRHEDTKVSDSRAAEEGSAIRRRRVCPVCERKFTTMEQIVLMVAKRNGVSETFNRDKVLKGVSKACQGRPVTPAQLATLAQRVEEDLRASGQAEIPSERVGLAILGPLSELDTVAYLRFASVYKQFESVEDFAKEIEELRLREAAEEELPAKPARKATRSSRKKATVDQGQEPLIG